MSLSSTTNRVSYAGNGSTTDFSFPYKFFANADLVIILVDSDGVETTKTITTHYTVAGASSESGGTVTMLTAPATGETLVIYRNKSFIQELDLVENDAAPAEETEKQLDKIVMMIQRLSDLVNRSVRLTDGFSDAFTLTLPADLATANSLLVVNAAGNGFDLGPTTTELADAEAEAAAAAVSASAASASADLAADWAAKIDGIVDSTDYSSKAWAIGGTGVTDTASRGASKEWAIETSGTVDGTSYSAKEWAQGTQTRGVSGGGSSKDWANYTADTVDDAEYSAKEWAQGTQTRGVASSGSAKDWATYTAGTVDDAEYSAKYYSQLAAASAAQAAAFFTDVIQIDNTDSPYTVDATHNGKFISVDTSGGAVTISLPEISGLTLPFTLGVKLDTAGNTLTVNPGGSDEIDFGASKAVSIDGAGFIAIAESSSTPDNWFTAETGGTGITSVATFGSTPNTAGASISGTSLTLQPADGTNPGGVSTAAQTFAGNKTFSGTILGPAGTNSLPAHSFSADPDTGIYNSATNTIAFATNAGLRAIINATGQLIVGGTNQTSVRHEFYNNSTTSETMYIQNRDIGSSSEPRASIVCVKGSGTTSTLQVFQQFFISAGATGSGQINANGAGAVAFGSFSDIRLKDNIKDLPSQLESIMKLRPVEFDYKDGSGHQIGFIAQEVERVYPDLIGKNVDGILTISGLSKTEARLVSAVQELVKKVEKLEDKMKEIKKQKGDKDG